MPDNIAQHAHKGIVYGFLLPTSGNATPVKTWEEITHWNPKKEAIWLHLDRSHDESQKWLKEDSGIDPAVYRALIAEETRPCCNTIGDGTLLILHGINQTPNENPEDMVSVRIWIEPKRVISLRNRRVMAAGDVAETLRSGENITNCADLVLQLIEHLNLRIEHAIEKLLEQLNTIETNMLVHNHMKRAHLQLTQLHLKFIQLSRHIIPQRKALTSLTSCENVKLTRTQKQTLASHVNTLARYAETLKSSKERIHTLLEERGFRLTKRISRNIYILTTTIAIFLPLNLVAGLFGTNLGGIPGSESSAAFFWFIGLLVAIGVLLLSLFKRNRWL